MKVEVELRTELKEKIEKLVKDHKYVDFDDFINKATETLIMAEERIKLFLLK